MSVIFQLFSAEDLNQLTDGQLNQLRNIVRNAVVDIDDTFLKASLAISNLINRRHMQGLLPGASYPSTASPPSSVNISQEKATDFQRAMQRLNERVSEVFHQLTGELPTGPSSSLDSLKLPPNELINQLLREEDLAKLDDKKRKILAWALTCELANFNAYEAFEQVKQKAEEAFMDFMRANGKGEQRPRGPDTPYSPFYPGSPLYPDRSGPNP